MEEGNLSERLDAAEGKGAFPSDIATLVSQHTPEDKPAADEEVTALRSTLKDSMPRSDITALCASCPKLCQHTSTRNTRSIQMLLCSLTYTGYWQAQHPKNRTTAARRTLRWCLISGA